MRKVFIDEFRIASACIADVLPFPHLSVDSSEFDDLIVYLFSSSSSRLPPFARLPPRPH